MTDAGFVFAAYGVIFGGLGLYALMLARRLRAARRRAGDDGEG
jgi:CcmD family protein